MQKLLPLLLVLLLPQLAQAQVDFMGAYVLSQRSASQGLTAIEDGRGNLYMAIPFTDTLKLKNPDQTFAAPSHRGLNRNNYALAILKVSPSDTRVRTQLFASSYNQPISCKWLWSKNGKLRLAVQTVGEITAGDQTAPPVQDRRWIAGQGHLDLDTNLQMTSKWQIDRQASDTAYQTSTYSVLAGPADDKEFIMGNPYADSVMLGGQVIKGSPYRRVPADPLSYLYLAAVNKANPRGPLAMKHVLWQNNYYADMQPAGITRDSVGNVYMAFQFQRVPAIYLDDSLLIAPPPINTPLAIGLGILKFSAQGRLIWKKVFINNYRVSYQAMTPTPTGDKLYLAVKAHGDLNIDGTVVQADTNFVGCGSLPGNLVAMVLDDSARVERYNMFVNRPKNRVYDTQVHSIVLSPFGEIYWGGVSSGFPKMFEQNAIQVWQTLYVTCTDLNFNFKWRKLVGGPVDGTYRSIDAMSFNPNRRELMYVGHLDHYVSATAVGVGPTVLNTVCPAQFVVKIGGMPVTETKAQLGGPLAVFPNPATSGQTVTVLSEDRSYRLTDALGRSTACAADADLHTVTLPQAAPGIYTLTGQQTGKRIRLVLER